MHVLHFGIKRAFHATLRVNRPLLARHGVTPARFDLLYAIHQERMQQPSPELDPSRPRRHEADRQSHGPLP